MEYWVLKADDGLILFSAHCGLVKMRSYSLKPVFQNSIIPAFQWIRYCFVSACQAIAADCVSASASA